MLRWLRNLSSGRNRRTFDRDPVKADALLTVGDHVLVCRISDVSPGGAFLSPPLDVPTGSEGVLRIPDVAIETPVRIVRMTPAGMGIEFVRDNVGAIIAGWTRGHSPA